MESAGFGILIKRVNRQGDRIVMRGVCALKMKTKGRFDPALLNIRTSTGAAAARDEERPAAGDSVIRSSFSMVRGIPFMKGYRLHGFRMEIRVEDALQLDIQNKLFLYYGEDLVSSVTYSLMEGRRGSYRNTRPIRAEGKSIYFRQGSGNGMWLVVRPQNLYDGSAQRIRVFAASLCAKLRGGSDCILMYEKEASRYEESASVLYEKLIDMGYRNVFYIVDPGNRAIADLPGKYRDQMIDKDSFRHLVYFFRCRTFIGTETVDHALQLRAANRRIMAKSQSRDLTHIFLQHGVMFMVSLDADLRVGFVNRRVRKYRTVVSSEAEAMHFILLGGFAREELYVTGLAKFDRSVRTPDADLIMIMPTWRRWETNLAQQDFTRTGYYRMLEEMVESVPEDLRDKIVIKPHPLMQSMMEAGQTPLSRYLRPQMSHDDTLKQCRLLMTDYSSIAYDAFYRGANVIFYWKEKESCMKHYGGAHLMLNDYNAFGDVCYDADQLAGAFRRNYDGPQDPVYLRRYGNIVNYHDGHNTERIIECLKRDGVI